MSGLYCQTQACFKTIKLTVFLGNEKQFEIELRKIKLNSVVSWSFIPALFVYPLGGNIRPQFTTGYFLTVGAYYLLSFYERS